MLANAFMQSLCITSNILGQFQQFFVQTRIRGDHFKHAEFPWVTLGIGNLAARFFEYERNGGEVMIAYVSKNCDNPIPLPTGHVARIDRNASEGTRHHADLRSDKTD